MKLVNIGNIGRKVFLFIRENGKRKVKNIETFYPYYYEENSDGKLLTYNGKKVKRIYASHPAEIRKLAGRGSWEADVQVNRRYLTTKVDKIDPTEIKWSFIDIETKSTEFPNPNIASDPISCITVYNSFTKEYLTYFLGDYDSEYNMLKDFTDYLYKEQFDFLCLDPQSEIKTINGLKKLKDIKKGDKLYSYDKKWNPIYSKVKEIYYSYKKTYTIKTKFDNIRASSEHMFPILNSKNLVYKNNSFKVTKQVKDLKKSDYLLFPINYLKHTNKFDNYHWFLGYYIADGTKGKTKRLEIKDDNFNLIYKAYTILKEELNIKSNIRRYNNHYVLYSGIFRAQHYKNKIDLINNNIIKYLNKISVDKQISFLCGLIDGDGSNSKNHLSLTNTNIELLKWGSFLLWGIGIPNNLTIKETNSENLIDYRNNQKIGNISIYNTDNNYKLKMYHPRKRLFSSHKYKYSSSMIPMKNIFLKLLKIYNPKINNKEYHKLYSSKDNRIAKALALSILKKIKLKKLTKAQYIIINKIEKLINNYYFVKIQKITKNNKKQKLIDIKLEKNHWFIANNILTHDCGWNFLDFDIKYLSNRIPDFAKLIGYKNLDRYGNRELRFPMGTSIIDYMEWLKKYTLDKEKSYALDSITSKYLLKGKTHKEPDFSKVSKEIKERNREDVKLMVKLEEKFNLIPYFDNIRRIAKVEWEDVVYNTRTIDSLILSEAHNRKVVLPSKPKPEEFGKRRSQFKSKVLRKTFQRGEFHGASSFDLSSCYPNCIIDFCLDHSNLRGNPNDNTLELVGAHFEQNEDRILPTIAKKLIKDKQRIKKERNKYNPESKEYKELDIAYRSQKGITNSLFGYCGDVRTRLFNLNIANAITRLPKQMLLYCIEKLKEQGIEALYADTDGVIFNTDKDISDLLNNLIQQWVKEKFNKKYSGIKFDYEGKFSSLFILKRCRYHGYLEHPNGEVEEKKVGLEMKRKDSTIYMKKFQKELLEKIHKDCSKEEIINWIKDKIDNFDKEKLFDISMPAKLSKKPKDYKTEVTNKHGTHYKRKPPIFVQAVQNSKLERRLGQSYYYAYFKKDSGNLVYAFDKNSLSKVKDKELDYKKMIERNIINKIKTIFDSLEWNDEFKEIKEYVKKRKKLIRTKENNE